MAFKFSDRKVNSVSELLDHLQEDKANLGGDDGTRSPIVWFRGMKSAKHDLIPTFHRESLKIQNEIYMMNIFKQNAHESLNQAPASEWEWMFLMRHHGLPSRLLDWTESPIVGLYFSVREEDRRSSEGGQAALWCLLPSRLNEWSLKWPSGSDILPMFTENKAEFSLPANETLLNYLPLPIPTTATAGAVTLDPAAGISVRTTRRIQAQLGVFTVHHSNKKALQKVGDGSHIWRFIVPADKHEQIREQLRTIGITRRIVFPDLDSVAEDAAQTVRGL